MEEILRENKGEFVLDGAASQELHERALSFVHVYTAVAQAYNTQGLRLFNVTIKMHYLVHASAEAGFLNPGLLWTYSGEDMMQRVRHLAASCARGTPPWLIGAKFMAKYTQALNLRMRDRRSWMRP